MKKLHNESNAVTFLKFCMNDIISVHQIMNDNGYPLNDQLTNNNLIEELFELIDVLSSDIISQQNILKEFIDVTRSLVDYLVYFNIPLDNCRFLKYYETVFNKITMHDYKYNLTYYWEIIKQHNLDKLLDINSTKSSDGKLVKSNTYNKLTLHL